MAANVYEQLARYRKARFPNAKEKLTPKEAMAVVDGIMARFAEEHKPGGTLSLLKGYVERQDRRCQIIYDIVKGKGIDLKRFPEAARGLKNAAEYERTELKAIPFK
jgi:hypothetical protein